MMGIILKSTMIGFGIATIVNCINIALAQIDPSTGESIASLSQSPAEQPVAVNPASTGNISAPGNISEPAVNSTTIEIPESPTIVGPSSVVASPITSEENGTSSTNSTG